MRQTIDNPMEQSDQPADERFVVDLAALRTVAVADHHLTAAVTITVVGFVGVTKSGNGFGVGVAAVTGVGAHAGRFATGFGGDGGGVKVWRKLRIQGHVARHGEAVACIVIDLAVAVEPADEVITAVGCGGEGRGFAL